MELISEFFVKPKHEVQASKNPIYLNSLEICMLKIYPTQKGLLYNNPLHQSPSTTLLNLLDTLKESLSIALVHFYPLAGRFATETFTDEHACSVFIDCNKGPGARLTHVIAPGVTKSDIFTPNNLVPSIVKKFFDFGDEYVNYDCHTRALLSIQVTQLIDGIFIGFTISHSVVDGTSFMHFLSMLSEIFCSVSTSGKLLGISRVPIYEHGPPIKLPYLGLEEVLTQHETTNMSKDLVFNLSSKSLAKIKAETNKNQEGLISNLSSFQALISLIWRAITRARNIVSADQETTCSIAINTRSRVDPPLCDDYFGNYVAQVKVTCKVEELLTNDLGRTATRLNDGIKSQDNKSIRNSLELIDNLIATPGFFNMPMSEFLGSNSVVLGGSTRFDMYGLEFGLGKAIATRIGPGNKSDGKVNVSQGCEGGGSVDLEISLDEDNLVALQNDHEFMSFVS